jgi:hypothetical protein
MTAPRHLVLGAGSVTRYQFVRPVVLDSSATERELGLAHTDWADICPADVELVRARSAA